jgi:hypothetical protein
MSAVSIPLTLPLIPIPESDEHLATKLRCARGQFAERDNIEGAEKVEQESLSDGGSIEAKQTAAAEDDREGDDSATEPESESDVFRVLQSIKRRKERSSCHSDQVPCNVNHRHPRWSFYQRIQAIAERLDGEPLLDCDDYERAGAALSIPSSDVSSLPSDWSITESFPEPVKAFVDMFQTESSDVAS